MLKPLVDLHGKKAAVTIGLIVATAVVTTGIYWYVYGFGHWKGEMQNAATLMQAAAVSPMPQATPGHVGAGQYVCPVHGAVGLPQFDSAGTPHCPLGGAVMTLHAVQPGSTLAVAPGG
jgi:hypothetical protein